MISSRTLHKWRRLVAPVVVASAIVLLAAGPAASTPRSPSVSSRSPSVYWGAYVEGQSTYGFMYGGEWGDSPWAAKSVAKYERDAGKRMSIEHYGQPPPWEQPFDSATADLAVRRGAIPAIDMSTRDAPLRAIVAGNYDASLRAWADAARAWGHPFFLLLNEE